MGSSHDSSSTASSAGGPSPSGAAQPLDPMVVIRSRPYIAALMLAALWVSHLGRRLRIPGPGRGGPGLPLRRAARADLRGAGTRVVAGALVGAVRAVDRVDHPVPAGHRRPLSCFRLQRGRRSAHRRELVGVILAALTTLSLGAVLGPEAPLIAIGGGLGALTVHLAKKDAPPMALTIMASAGSFAAISTLLGSPCSAPS